ncbi:MAG: ArsB/NhaD family transporter [Candidatus Thermoplasmatota archaeon]|nr:ArsB/NhaD family transporter [Candidatus Thermoplasmatota archaeon]MEC7350264.1 ArsB/NhaD family transporter [Candidatus Thermoplasmatota archaeon]MEC7444636.1 ArsB/NhaD family transporter [Candidatus Thermoplasmatota archaeon]MEC7504875.1 ArsB/NhaD family transporter [Candidatus Thermoplasmatota archaeon]MEC7626386.1 ArsB/NhaD family transporter [Candidatus Thermoplasmatota archaeon]
MNAHLFTNRSRQIAFGLMMFVGAMMFANPTQAGGGGGLGLDIKIKDGLETQAVYVGLAILIAVYVLIIFEWVHRTLAAAVGGIVAMLALNYYDKGDTLSLAEVTTMIDWETIGLLLGMMVMVGILSNTGVFEYFAVLSYKQSGGSIWTLVVILCSVTAVLSAFLDNVTTMLLLTPVTIQLAKVLDIKPIPLLISEVLFSNIGGAATMIGDPPNIMIGSGLSPAKIEEAGYSELAQYGVTFNDFIIEMAPGILMCIVPSFMMLKWFYADEFSGSRVRDIAELEAKYGIKDQKMLNVAGFILFLVILNFFLHPITHIAVSWIALVGAVVMLLATDRHELEEPLHHVEWTTLLFFAGLFVLVHSLQYMGVINYIGDYVMAAIEFFGSDTGDGQTVRLAAAILIVLWVSAVASAFIDNIPYTATMIPIVLQIADELGDYLLDPLIWALAFGACLGGNGTLIGASANVVTAGMSEEAGYPISFNEFFKAGFPVMILTTFIVSLYMLLVFIVGGEDNAIYVKLILVGITTLSIIGQLARGRSKGKTFAEALVDDEMAGIEEMVVEAKSVVVGMLRGEEE